MFLADLVREHPAHDCKKTDKIMVAKKHWEWEKLEHWNSMRQDWILPEVRRICGSLGKTSRQKPSRRKLKPHARDGKQAENL